jgi:hypothetical protein
MSFTEEVYEGVKWINLVLDRDQMPSLENSVLRLRFL